MDARPNSFQLPIPPPPLHTRSLEKDQRPTTPAQDAFLSPQQTPQGSPSKHHHPPGAFDLPHVFENAMRLLPTMGSPTRSKPGTPTSPNKPNVPTVEDTDYATQDMTTLGAAGPTRKSNKENTPPNIRSTLSKDSGFVTQAAQSRQEPYRPRDAEQQSSRYYPGLQRLSAEELEKARKPQVKRLANVTQLCTYSVTHSAQDYH